MNKKEAKEDALDELIAALKTEEYHLGYMNGYEHGLDVGAKTLQCGLKTQKTYSISDQYGDIK